MKIYLNIIQKCIKPFISIWFVMITLSLNITSCSTFNNMTQDTDTTKSINTNAIPVKLTFFDSKVFDDSLHGAMLDNSLKVKIDIPGGMNLQKIPPRMDKWIYVIKETGGKVTTVAVDQYGSVQRGLIAEAVGLVVSGFDYFKNKELFEPAEKYSIMLYYDPDGIVKLVELYPR